MNKTEFINKLNEFCKSDIIENENFIKDRIVLNFEEIRQNDDSDCYDLDFDERENAIYETGIITAYQNIIQFLKNNI